ncbi:MAG TPA: hypothetical protein VGK74_17295 [Symbiobacteriaceae bacterium]
MHGMLCDLIHVQANWTRSVNVERDAADWAAGSAHYTLTPLSLSIMEQAVTAILNPKSTRAWTITGPYGTGKSAFALALTQLLSSNGPHSPMCGALKQEAPELANRFAQVWASKAHFFPVLINGQRAALIPALADGLRRALRASDGNADLVSQLDILDPADAVGLTTLYETAAARVGGLLVIIDELGKFLEYVAQRPDRSDVFVLQLLAEAASRSETAPFLVFGILHQAFVRYGAHLTQVQRDEFSKIRGRFADIAFNQSHDLMLRLVGDALQSPGPSTEVKLEPLKQQVQALAEQVVKAGLGLGGVNQSQAVSLLTRCAPIHPISALVLGPLFRRLAQNERSLFTFISSAEPFGLREFLQKTSATKRPVPLYAPDRLYDYVMSALGTALYQDIAGRRWTEVEASLDRLRDGSPLEVRLVKTIGLLTAVGEAGNLRATPKVLALCFGEPTSEVDAALKRLVLRKVIVYRSFVDAYRLWEGSDIDIEERLNAASAYVDEAKGLDELLLASVPPRPIVARRHSFEKGTLRFADVSYVSYERLATKLASSLPSEADGRLIYVLTESPAQTLALGDTLVRGELPTDDLTVVVSLQLGTTLHGAALELERLKWVRENTPELTGDLVAQRELRSRLYETEQILRRELELGLSPTATNLYCYWRGTVQKVQGLRELNQFLSSVYDAVYAKTPVILNELINRRQLSSAAAAARRLLLEAMLEHAAEPNLGITGHPPQLSMYLSVLSANRLHVKDFDGTYRLAAPPADSPLAPVWDIWKEFLHGAREHRRSLRELWDQLSLPPLGLRDGVIPVLILVMMLERSSETGIYEAGSFVSELTLPHAERFMRSPEKFEIRYCPMDGLRLEVFTELSQVLGARSGRSLVPLVRALVRNVAKLPPYAQKTQSLTEPTRRVRAALMNAQEPDVLLFDELPKALGYPSMLKDAVPGELVRPFVKSLVASISEMNKVYRLLLDKLFALLSNGLALPERLSDALSALRRRAGNLRDVTLDLRVKGFLDHLLPPEVPEAFDVWVESIGSFVASRPPSTWNDSDLARYESELAGLLRKVRNLEDIAFTQGTYAPQEHVDALRLGLTTQSGEELHKVVVLKPAQRVRVELLESRLATLLTQHDFVDEEDQLVALVLITQRLLKNAANH